DKMWFFGSGLWDPIRQAGFVSSSGSSIIPTPAGLATLKAAFPNSVGVALLDKIGPASKTFGNPVYTPPSAPLPVTDWTTNALVQFGTLQRFVALPSNEKQFSARYDYQISSKDRFSARYIIDNQDNPLGANANSVQGYRVDVPSRSQNVALDYTRNITNNVVNQARLSYGRNRVAFEGGTTGCTNATITTCATAVTLTSTSSVFSNPLLSFGLSTTFPQDRLVNNTQYQDNASWLHGKHLIKFGGEYDQQRSPSTFL